MLRKVLTEFEILNGIRANSPQVFEYMYQTFTPAIYRDVIKNSGTREDAEDHFQDTMLTVVANVMEGKYDSQGKFEAYFFMVSRNLWYKKLRSRGHMPTNEFQGYEETNEPEDINVERVKDMIEHDKMFDLVLIKLKELGEDCYNLLTKFYYEKKALQDIADEFNWSYKYVRKRNYLCKQELRNLVEQDQEYLTMAKA